MEQGAHLITPRFGYVHHGIYVGGGRVIHYAGFKRFLSRGPVEEVSLDEFAGGHPVEVIGTGGCAAVARARQRLGEDRYRFFTNNCEHFARWCISGLSRSLQVEAWLRFI